MERTLEIKWIEADGKSYFRIKDERDGKEITCKREELNDTLYKLTEVE